jgi:hypothetical protein
MSISKCLVPCLNWPTIANLVLLIGNSRSFQLVSIHNVKPSFSFFLVTETAHLVKSHLINSVLFSHSFFPNTSFNIILDFKPSFLVLFPQVFLHESLCIFYLHAYWVVHQTFILNCKRQLLYLILTMDECVFSSFNFIGIFLFLVVILAVNNIKIMLFPVLVSCFSSENAFVSY